MYFLWLFALQSIIHQIYAASLVPQQLDALIDVYYSMNVANWSLCGSVFGKKWNITEFQQGNFNCSVIYCALNVQTIGQHCYVTELKIAHKNATGYIPYSIGNLTQLVILEIRNNKHLTSQLPQTIFKLNRLEQLYIYYNGRITLTSPNKQLWCNLQSLTTLELTNINYNNGFITDFECLFNKTTNRKFSKFQLEEIHAMKGSIPPFICNLSVPAIGQQEILISAIHDLDYSEIPTCINKLKASHVSLAFTNLPALHGTIPNTICDLQDKLFMLAINNNKHLTGSVPECIFNSTLTAIQLSNNSLSGNIPVINMPQLTSILLNDNHFEGSLSEIFSGDIGLRLIQIALQNNNFHDNDISDLFRKWLNENDYPLLEVLQIFGNKHIDGYIPDENITNNHIIYFMAHSCDLHGSIPNNLKLSQVKYLTLFDNRLSCNIPESFVVNLKNLNITLVLSENLFSVNSYSVIPKWVKDYSLFASADNLYVTKWTNIKTIVMMVMSGLCLILATVFVSNNLYKKCRKQYQEKTIEDVRHRTFIYNIHRIQSIFIDYKLMLCVIILLILYSTSSYYFQCSPVLIWFNVCFFYSDSDWKYWILFTLCIIFNIIVIYEVFYLCLDVFSLQCNKKTDESNLIRNVVNDGKNKSMYLRVIAVIWYSFLYLFFTAITIFYLIFESLPNDNILRLNDIERNIIINIVSLILAINTSIIIPNLVDSISSGEIHHYHRSKIILLLRTMNIILIPMISAIFLLNDCGNYWTKLWNPCRVNGNDFNIDTTYATNQIDSFEAHVLTQNDVCNPKGINEIQFDKCIRSFFYQWSYVVMVKVIIMIFMPMFVILSRWIRRRTLGKCIKKWSINKTAIDSEYCMIVTNLETVIIFSFICPLIVPVTFIAIQSNKYFYNIMINKLEWPLKSYSDYKSFPVQFLVIGIFIEQFLSFVFFHQAIHKDVITYLLLSFLIIIDMVFVFLYIFKIKQNGQVIVINEPNGNENLLSVQSDDDIIKTTFIKSKSLSVQSDKDNNN
eukprot:264273_1